MAAKRRRVVKKKELDLPVSGVENEFVFEEPQTKKPKLNKVWLWAALVVAGIVFWWWRTDTWPVVAVVNNQLVTRYEVDKGLFGQYGRSFVEDLVVQKAVEAEVAKMKLTPTKEEVDAKITEIEATLPEGQKLAEVVAARGMSVDELRKQISLRVAIEKAVQDSATVSAEQINDYMKDNAQYLTGSTPEDKRTEAESALKQQALQASIANWIESIRSTAKVWTIWPTTSPAASPASQP